MFLTHCNDETRKSMNKKIKRESLYRRKGKINVLYVYDFKKLCNIHPVAGPVNTRQCHNTLSNYLDTFCKRPRNVSSEQYEKVYLNRLSSQPIYPIYYMCVSLFGVLVKLRLGKNKLRARLHLLIGKNREIMH